MKDGPAHSGGPTRSQSSGGGNEAQVQKMAPLNKK
jgi:hypothetical protein